LEVDGERRRLSLSLKRVGEDGTVSEAPDLGLSDEVFTDLPTSSSQAYEETGEAAPVDETEDAPASAESPAEAPAPADESAEDDSAA
jgi:hypothetical protein